MNLSGIEDWAGGSQSVKDEWKAVSDEQGQGGSRIKDLLGT